MLLSHKLLFIKNALTSLKLLELDLKNRTAIFSFAGTGKIFFRCCLFSKFARVKINNCCFFAVGTIGNKRKKLLEIFQTVLVSIPAETVHSR